MEEGCDRHNASLSNCLQNLPAASVIAAIRRLSGEEPGLEQSPLVPANKRRAALPLG
ncbi:MAG: hypothetical protein AWT59_2803 [Candidatus Gallionella acididurans]|uniref:Uncharacterized protein n=1 Tax=Candidatus Gallionella acididurans TaxID=1796491 RepID=A0A139BQH6_9PROT|nr:MAG: hypothetical protein AWT59_2803 [Candidatus Gallionella acididurans]